MAQLNKGMSWYALKIFFGKGKPIKAYFVANGIEHIYDVKKDYWDKDKKKRIVKEVPIMPSLILFRTTKTKAIEIERVYTNLKVYHFLIKKCTTPNRLRRYA